VHHHRVENLFRLQDLELVLQKIRVVAAAALRLEEFDLPLGLLDANLGRGQVPPREKGRDDQRGDHHQRKNQQNQGLAQPQQTQEISESRAVLADGGRGHDGAGRERAGTKPGKLIVPPSRAPTPAQKAYVALTPPRSRFWLRVGSSELMLS